MPRLHLPFNSPLIASLISATFPHPPDPLNWALREGLAPGNAANPPAGAAQEHMLSATLGSRSCEELPSHRP